LSELLRLAVIPDHPELGRLFLKERLAVFIILVEAIKQEGSESGASCCSLPPNIAGIHDHVLVSNLNARQRAY
jgi:hypothetical protein